MFQCIYPVFTYLNHVIYIATCTFSFAVHRVRLIDGPNSRTGRVEVYINRTGGVDNAEWGAICGDYWWSFFDARVVCRQLGYPDAFVAVRYGLYGDGNGPYWLDDVRCRGNETDIFTCAYVMIENYLCYYGSAAAECLGVLPGTVHNSYITQCIPLPYSVYIIWSLRYFYYCNDNVNLCI